MDRLESLERASMNLLSRGIKEDTATGSTPRKRKWKYVDDWTLTASRHELLSRRSEKENLIVEPKEMKVALSEPEVIENETRLTETHLHIKAEEMRSEPVPLEPLVDSRRRNLSRTARRAR